MVIGDRGYLFSNALLLPPAPMAVCAIDGVKCEHKPCSASLMAKTKQSFQ